jgi:catechol 2,3-dioxygenase-like lactoylglutathione lyase family enzyme
MRSGFVFIVVLGFFSAWGAAAPADPNELDGIAHVAFRVNDVSASRDFYTKLGFDQAFEFKDAIGTTTSYLKVNDRQFIELYRRAPDQPLGLMHICFDVHDIEQLRTVYEAAGLKPPPAVKARAGNLLFNLRGPEGEVIEYTQYLPGSLHWNARGTPSPDRRISEHIVEVVVEVKDLRAEHSFYIDKLGFRDHGDGRLCIPGTSTEKIVLEPSTSHWKPKIGLAVTDVRRAVDALRKRGLTPEVVDASAVVQDPDGTQLLLTPVKGVTP